MNIKILLRDFDTSELQVKADLVKAIASEVEQEHAGIEIVVEHQKQYRNMADGLPKEPRAVEFAKQAHDELGLEYRLSSIRGGTDGSMLTEKGLPTPNLSSGQHTQHSPLEWACLDEMIQQGQVLLQTAIMSGGELNSLGKIVSWMIFVIWFLILRPFLMEI